MKLETIKEWLSYNPDTGDFVWLKSPNTDTSIGSVAGKKIKAGYMLVWIDGRYVQLHRLAWFYAYGEFPKLCIDHINGIAYDNRISNLRLATVSENRCNSKLASHNTSGFKGVSWHKASSLWQVQVKKHGKVKCLGYFKSPELAHEAYCKEAKLIHGEFARFK